MERLVHPRREGQAPAIAASGSWLVHPRIAEDTYNVTDAVLVGALLCSLLRHGDRVKIANQAQLVNVIAPIRSEPGGPAHCQSTFWPFARMSELAKDILRTAVESDRYETSRFGAADLVDVSDDWDQESGEMAFLLAHRGLEEAADVEISLRGFPARPHRAGGGAVRSRGWRPVLVEQPGHRPRPDAPLRRREHQRAILRVRLPVVSWVVIATSSQVRGTSLTYRTWLGWRAASEAQCRCSRTCRETVNGEPLGNRRVEPAR